MVILTNFILDKAAVDHATQNPYPGCRNPSHAALGRVAEPHLITQIQVVYNVAVQPYNSPLLLSKYKNTILAKDKRHDGLVFIDDQFIGVLEAKTLVASGHVEFPLIEKEVLDFCIANDVPYLLALATCNSVTREVQPLGMLDVTKIDPVKSGVFSPTYHKIYRKGFDLCLRSNFGC